jgi:hypothetical protein
MIKFREKIFTNQIINDVAKGATRGFAVGGLLAAKVGKRQYKTAAKLLATSTLIGAGLGLVYSLSKEFDTWLNRKTTVDDRILGKSVQALLKKGLKQDKDFTMNPKMADSLKVKVCILVSKYSEDLRLNLNVVNDSKLKSTASKILRNIPGGLVKTENIANNKYNEITVSTLSSASDPDIVAEVAREFIAAGYPVYLVEVG